MIYTFQNGIHPFIALRRGNHLGEETCREELHTQNDGQKREIEQRPVCHAVSMGKQPNVSQIRSNDETYQERDGTQHAEKVHGSIAEFRDEIDCQKVEIAANETAHAKLATAIFPLLMVNDFLPYVAETVHLSNDGNVTVHFAVHLNAFHHFLAISLQAAIEIVQLNARHHPRGPIEELGRDVFHQFGVVTHFLPA